MCVLGAVSVIDAETPLYRVVRVSILYITWYTDVSDALHHHWPSRQLTTHTAGRATAAWAPLPALQHERVEIVAGDLVEKGVGDTELLRR